MDFVELDIQRERFRDNVIQVIGSDLNGFKLDDCAMEHLQQAAAQC